MGTASIGAFDDSSQAGRTRRYITDAMPVEYPIMRPESPWANDRRGGKGVADPVAQGQHARIAHQKTCPFISAVSPYFPLAFRVHRPTA